MILDKGINFRSISTVALILTFAFLLTALVGVWAAYDRDDPCWPCQWGTVTGIENVQPGKGFEILPAVTGSQAGALDGNGTSEEPYRFENEDIDGDFSLGANFAF